MPHPSASLATLRPEIAGSFQEWMAAADRAGYIGHRVLPVFDTAIASGSFGKIPIESLLENRETRRAPGAGYSRSSFDFTTDTYACEEHGAEEPVDDREANVYAEYFDAEMVAAERAMTAVLVNAEKRIADAVFNTTTWTGASLTTTVSTEWSTPAGATPIDDVNDAVQLVYDGTGLWPNALIIDYKVFRNLRECDQIIEAIASVGAGDRALLRDITTSQLAAVFDLPFILVGGGTRNSAIEGQDATPVQIWDDEYAMIARIQTSNDIREPGLGRTFHYTGDGSSVDGTVESYREEQTRSEIIRVRHDVDEKILYTGCGHLLQNITA